jgi:hypothetical protein
MRYLYLDGSPDFRLACRRLLSLAARKVNRENALPLEYQYGAKSSLLFT